MSNFETFFALARERYRIKLRKEYLEHGTFEFRSRDLCEFGNARRADGTCHCDSCLLVRQDQVTSDPIFAKWKFCNVFREDDRTTVWFRRNLRGLLQQRAADVLFATVLFRWFNRIETAELIREHFTIEGYDEAEVRRKLTGVKPVVTGAYVIKTPDGMTKLEGILKCMRPILADAPELGNGFLLNPEAQLQGAWEVLQSYPYLGSFMAYEIVSDLRHTVCLRNAPDILTWAAAGPGCARGLGWVVSDSPGRFNYNSARDQTEMLKHMGDLLAASRRPEFWPTEWPRWEMREVEHWLCETWKYIRCRDHGIPPKGRYAGHNRR